MSELGAFGTKFSGWKADVALLVFFAAPWAAGWAAIIVGTLWLVGAI